MKIQVGEILMDEVTNQRIFYPNKTKKYLLPCLKQYGDVFISKLSNVFKVAVGIGDVITDNHGFKHEKHIFILLDSTVATAFFIKFLAWVKDQPMYEDDYVFGNTQKSNYHMIVLKFPETFYEAFDNFKQSKYSQMFSQETIDGFFHKFPTVKKILVKDHNYRLNFTKKLNKKYDLEGIYQIKPEEWEGELDFPIDEEEIFNNHIKKK
jgi:hypothetical protein